MLCFIVVLWVVVEVVAHQHSTPHTEDDGNQRFNPRLRFNYDGTVYATTLTEFNVRDQANSVKQLKGDATLGAACQLGACQQTDFAYDGHGRLQKQYLPIYQPDGLAPPYNNNSAARSMVLEYNSDDTLYRETDPRGATATYSYNNRGLVSSIGYFAPGGVASKPNVTFGYDELGLRSSMTDGAGTATYYHNSLGQTTSEARVFTLPGAPSGTFTIAYDYNLAGQLKMVRDPFNDQINYSYDKAGKLQTVTGQTAFAGMTSYLSGVQYRAWGAVKTNRTYDSRLRLTTAGSISYEYNAAGDMTYAGMNSGAPYHQTFSYDQVGRLASVSTPEQTVPNQYVCTVCSPPNGLLPYTKVRPFTVSLGYDEFDHANNTSHKLWFDKAPNLNDTPQVFQTSYVNNRAKKDNVAGRVVNQVQQSWGYNNRGQITNDSRTLHTYDAAGQMTRQTDRVNSNNFIDYTFDGDGRQLKFDRKIENASTEVRYRLYSSVLGGVLTNIGTNGQKIETKVFTLIYENDSVRQVKAYTVNIGSTLNVPDTVVFEGADPHGTRATVWDHDTNTYKTMTLAAPGSYVEDIDWQGLRNRFVSNIGSQAAYGQQAASQYLSSYFSLVDPRNPGTGCSLDGQKVNCQSLYRGLNNGSVGKIVLSTTGGLGGGNADNGVIVGAFSLAQGQIAAELRSALKRRDGLHQTLRMGGDIVGEWDTPPSLEITGEFFFGGGQQGGGQPPKPQPAPTPVTLPACYITLVARKIKQVNITSGRFKGTGVNAYHLYLLTRQSGENSQQIHHGYPYSDGQVLANTAPFDSNNWDYTDTQDVGYLGSVEAVAQQGGSCDEIRKNFLSTQQAINTADIPYSWYSDNSNAVAYTFLTRFNRTVLTGLESKLFFKLGIHALLAPNNVPRIGPIVPGWGNDLLSR